MRDKYLGLIFSIIILSIQLLPGSNIVGRISDKETGEALPGANIVIEGKSIGTSADEEGYYELFVPDDIHGDNLLIASFVGYHDAVRKITFPLKEQLNINIELPVSLLSMDQIVVTGTRTERFLKDTPVTTQVIKGQTLEESGSTDVGEILSEVNGVSVDQHVRFGSEVDIQGFDNNHILVLINGMKMIGRVNGNLDIAQIPSSEIERIEVVKGPTSALYGSQGMGGVINIITKEPAKKLSINSDLKAGSYGRYDGNLSLSYPLGKWQPYISGSYRKYGGFDLDKSTPIEDGSRLTKYDGQFGLTGKIVNDLELNLQGWYFQEERRRNLSADFEEKSTNDRTAVRAQAETKTMLPVEVNTSLEFSQYDHLYGEIVRRSGYFKGGDRNIDELLKYDLLTSKNWNNNKLSLGYSYEYESVNSDRVESKKRNSNLHNIFLQDEYKFNTYLTLLGGIRFDSHSIYGEEFSPKFSLMVSPTYRSRIRLSFGHGFRAPSFKELYLMLRVPDVNLIVDGNPDLKPERSNAINADYELWNSNNYHLRLNLFYNKISNLIDDIRIDDGTPNLIYTYRNFASASTWGGEWDMKYFPTYWIEVTLGYSYLDSHDEKTGGPLPGRAKHRGKAGFIITFPRDIKLNMRSFYTGERLDTQINDETGEISEKIKINDYFLVNGNVSMPLPYRLKIYLGVRNLTDYVDKIWGPMPGREFYSGLTYKF